MTDDLRIAVPPGWDELPGGEGAVLLAVVGPRQPGSALAPTLVASASAPTTLADALRATLATVLRVFGERRAS